MAAMAVRVKLAHLVTAQVSVLQGALDCWVFLSCLEVLHRIEGCCDRTQLEANCSHTVGLWTYATEKVCTSPLRKLLSMNWT